MNLKLLHDLLEGVDYEILRGSAKVQVAGLAVDTRKLAADDVFIAIKGTALDGHQFIDQAIESGAKVIVCSDTPDRFKEGVHYLLVADTTLTVARMASNYWGNPSSKLKLIGITGTNGKTTIATLLYELIQRMGFKAGLLSTVENRVGNKVFAATHTTPDILNMNALFAAMVDEGCDYAVMEVSSHAIHQQRIAGLDFDGGVFTNLTVDHLDYHNSFKEYVYVKKKFFDLLKPDAFALINADDKNGTVMVQNSKASKHSYSIRRMADFKGIVLRNSLHGLQMKINQQEVHFRLIGLFNAYNLLGVYGAAVLAGFKPEDIFICLSAIEAVRGRFEIVYNDRAKITGIIDYAHTADALENVLETIIDLREDGGKIITLTGAGGDRDKSKRPEMGYISAKLSDTVIFTTDNPRSEDPAEIIKDMIAGVGKEDSTKVLQVLDRAEAIRVATKIASEGDVILIAGKGHEDYQDIKGVKHPFDDKIILKNIWF